MAPETIAHAMRRCGSSSQASGRGQHLADTQLLGTRVLVFLARARSWLRAVTLMRRRENYAAHEPSRWPIFDSRASSDSDEAETEATRRQSGNHSGPATSTDFSFAVETRRSPQTTSPARKSTAANSPSSGDDSEIDFSYAGVQRRATKALARQVDALKARFNCVRAQPAFFTSPAGFAL